jgi:hypothetical protein
MTDKDDVLPFDPKFPDRPRTRDFAALSLAVRNTDARADEGESLEDIYSRADFDLDSVIYMATQRAKRLADRMTPEDYTQLIGMLGAQWADAFMAGLTVGEGRAIAAATKTDGSRRQGNG